MNRLYIVVIIIITLLIGCQGNNTELVLTEEFYKSGTNDSNYIELVKVNDNVWIHTTYINYDGNRTPANGLVVKTSDGLVLIDTPWTNEQTEELINTLKELFRADFSFAIVTHAHDDNIGGIDKLLEKNIEVISTKQTVEEALNNGFTQPLPKLKEHSIIEIGETKIETYYPGEGHSSDNIVVWIPKYRLLFGGCLIKSIDTKNLGNIKEANLEEWSISIDKVKERYRNIEIVVPGHGYHGDIRLLEHTINLLKAK